MPHDWAIITAINEKGDGTMIGFSTMMDMDMCMPTGMCTTCRADFSSLSISA